MKAYIFLGVTLALTACHKSDSSDDAPASNPVVAGPDDAGIGPTPTPTPTPTPEPTPEPTPDPTPTPEPEGEIQEPIKLNSTALEYSFLQYDCGKKDEPLPAAAVEAQLKGAKNFLALAATVPAKDQALVQLSVMENGVSCTYRSLFSISRNFASLTWVSSQALTESNRLGCGETKTGLDSGFSEALVTFDYEKPLIRWVAMHIPAGLQIAPVCATGKLRAVFAAKT